MLLRPHRIAGFPLSTQPTTLRETSALSESSVVKLRVVLRFVGGEHFLQGGVHLFFRTGGDPEPDIVEVVVEGGFHWDVAGPAFAVAD